MGVDGMYQLYRKRNTISGWTGPVTYLYLPTNVAMQYMRGAIYLEDGVVGTGYDFDVAIEVQLQRFAGANYSGGVWSGGAWTTFAELELSLNYDYSTNSFAGTKWDDVLAAPGLFRTLVQPVMDPTKANSLMQANTHTAAPVANETDLRIGIAIDPSAGLITGTEFGVSVMALMGS